MSNESTQPNADISRPHKRIHRNTRVLAIIALLLALLGFLLRSLGSSEGSTSPTPAPSICETGAPGETGAQGDPGLSAYQLWLGMGNVGTPEEFLTSLIGEPGVAGEDGKVIYYGSDGVTGPQGVAGATGAAGPTGSIGKSAYQLWLEAGNAGTSDEFLASLLGADGTAGTVGLSAYQVWLAIGNTGSEQQFFDSLVGVSGTDGVDGSPGLSAYDIWVNNGNSGTEGEFLATLIGPQGTDGAPGICTVGDTGNSAYEIWLADGHVGSEQVFLASLIGPQGPKGDTGDRGPAGSAGFGSYGSFYDVTDQFLRAPGSAQPWTFTNSAMSNGVSIQSNGSGNSRIKFAAAGKYNIAFSTVFSKTNSNSSFVDIWFAENGSAIAESNTRLAIAGQAETVAAWNFFYNCTDPNKYLEIFWYTSSNDVYINTIPAQTSPDRPLTPAIIMTVNQVG